ncbi:MAG: drug/metabolite transporter (DMT)-like permease [Flavobacteriales bacterium]|jgi:drug/metabolite transporter (DMT)-like permease
MHWLIYSSWRARIKLIIPTLIALTAFAGNSILCRLALGGKLIDPASFSAIRLSSGALILAVILLVSFRSKARVKDSPRLRRSLMSMSTWFPALALFIYVITFSLAYQYLTTGTGALVLFSSVQFTMVLYQLWQGEKLSIRDWIGLSLAFLGFVLLVLPSLKTPSLIGFILMACSGIAWAGYSLIGRGSKAPLEDTGMNFALCLPMAALLLAFVTINQGFDALYISGWGLLLALASGVFASGLGYALWYFVLPSLGGARAAVVQLLVPVLAAVAGLLFARENISLLFAVSSVMVLGGVFLVVKNRPRKHFEVRYVRR